MPYLCLELACNRGQEHHSRTQLVQKQIEGNWAGLGPGSGHWPPSMLAGRQQANRRAALKPVPLVTIAADRIIERQGA